jgi:transposase InsO family protein
MVLMDPTEGCHIQERFSVVEGLKNHEGGFFMTEDQKKRMAVFRFGVIHDLINGNDVNQGHQEALIRQKCARKWEIPYSEKTRIGRSTILRWVRLYRLSNGKIESLYPAERSDRGESRAMDEETILSLIRLRQEMPKATTAVLIKTMADRGLVASGTELNLSTIYRFLHQHNLMKTSSHQPEDRRKFEAELPNDMWQSDVMHGPLIASGGKMKKSYLIALLDDHSRLITHGEFYLSEGILSYVDALENALLKRGLPRKLYVDNGPAFRSLHLEHITASLGIALIHSRPYKPQGRGKIERFFKTVREAFLAGFRGETLDDLNMAFDVWLTDVYHARKHTATGQSPFERFTSNMACLRAAPADLRDHFRKAARRTVAKDRTLTVGGKLYEAPVALIGKRVEILYHDSEPDRIEIRFGKQSYGYLLPVDIHVNCRVKRYNHKTVLEAADGQKPYRGGKLWSGKKEAAHE